MCQGASHLQTVPRLAARGEHGLSRTEQHSLPKDRGQCDDREHSTKVVCFHGSAPAVNRTGNELLADQATGTCPSGNSVNQPMYG